MSRQELERLARSVGYEPEADDRDSDLLAVIEARLRERKQAA